MQGCEVVVPAAGEVVVEARLRGSEVEGVTFFKTDLVVMAYAP
jgi:hypothetical protein